MTRQEYILLYQKYISGTCTDEEIVRLEEFQDGFELLDLEWDEALMGQREEAKESIQSALESNIRTSGNFRIGRLLVWSAAAAVLIIMSAGIYIQFYKDRSDTLASKESRFKNDVAAGRNKAVLTLDNGAEIVLDDAKTGVLAKQGNAEVQKGQKGQLVYMAAGNNAAVEKISYNTVSTPSGGQYQIVLPDGTKVWLNAASSMRFPTAFVGKDRKVELLGEAYFEVSKNAHKPFKVIAKGMEVKVLGTHFNIMAYNDENKINTTLLEGAVEVSKGSDRKYLKPGQQASIAKNNGNMSIADVNVENEVAWKNGLFVFNNEDIHSIMRKISRWYNVDVDFEGNLNNKDFKGTVSRSGNVSEILNMLELTEAIHFKIEGRRITVMP